RHLAQIGQRSLRYALRLYLQGDQDQIRLEDQCHHAENPVERRPGFHSLRRAVNCPECGAAECEARYHDFLVKEFEDPGYGAVHHLTVATYMLQHSSALTKEGWLFERNLLREFLIEKKPAAFIRQQNR